MTNIPSERLELAWETCYKEAGEFLVKILLDRHGIIVRVSRSPHHIQKLFSWEQIAEITNLEKVLLLSIASMKKAISVKANQP